MRRLLTPWGTYGALRDQLGSIRGVYLAGNSLDGRRDDFGTAQEVVLLLHGFFQTRNIWEVMEDRLRFDGYAVMTFNLGGMFGFNTRAVDALADQIAEKLDGLMARHGFDALHIVGHSKGGIVARRYVQHYGGDKHVKSVVTLGSPHHGTPTALIGVAGLGMVTTNPKELMPRSAIVRALSRDTFPAHIPLTSIYSKHDVVCPWWCSVLRPRPGESSMENVAVARVGHSQLTWDPGIYRIVRERLETASVLYQERRGSAEAPAAR